MEIDETHILHPYHTLKRARKKGRFSFQGSYILVTWLINVPMLSMLFIIILLNIFGRYFVSCEHTWGCNHGSAKVVHILGMPA